MTTLPLNFPGLRDEAERLMDELFTPEPSPDSGRLADAIGPLIRAQARLLADLTRPESRYFWVRVLVARSPESYPSGEWDPACLYRALHAAFGVPL